MSHGFPFPVNKQCSYPSVYKWRCGPLDSQKATTSISQWKQTFFPLTTQLFIHWFIKTLTGKDCIIMSWHFPRPAVHFSQKAKSLELKIKKRGQKKTTLVNFQSETSGISKPQNFVKLFVLDFFLLKILCPYGSCGFQQIKWTLSPIGHILSHMCFNELYGMLWLS